MTTIAPSAHASPLLMSIEAAASKLGICRASVYRLIRQRELQVVKIGRRSLISAEELARYVSALA